MQTIESVAKGGVVVLIGLPATGKSGLARKLADTANGVRVVHVELDALARRLSAAPAPSQQFDRDAWRTSRVQSRERVETELATGGGGGVIVVDDNAHLRSMRLAFARIAAAHGAAFAEVFVGPVPPCSLDELASVKAHNAGRDNPVPAAVIDAMAAVLEPPDAAHHAWERHNLTLPAMWNGGAARVGEVWGMVQRAVQEGPLVLVDAQAVARLHAEQEQSRAANARSAVHQADLWSRAAVARAIASVADPADRARVATAATALRKRFLASAAAPTATEGGGYDADREQQFMDALFSLLMQR